MSKVKVTVTWNINTCPLNNFEPIELRDTIIGVLVGRGRQIIPIDVGVSRSKVKEIWSIKSLSTQLYKTY